MVALGEGYCKKFGCSGTLFFRLISGSKMPKKFEIKWLNEPEKHNYPAALSYLCLLYDEKAASTYIEQLQLGPIVEFKAKDIFRASGLSLLGISNIHIEKNRQKIESGHSISPLLLIRSSINGRVIVADGYHRLCAIYSYDEDAVIPCKIV
jgi:hypothetical protein